LIKIIILEENFKWHLEAFASELVIYSQYGFFILNNSSYKKQFIKTWMLLYTLFSLGPVFIFPSCNPNPSSQSFS